MNLVQFLSNYNQGSCYKVKSRLFHNVRWLFQCPYVMKEPNFSSFLNGHMSTDCVIFDLFV